MSKINWGWRRKKERRMREIEMIDGESSKLMVYEWGRRKSNKREGARGGGREGRAERERKSKVMVRVNARESRSSIAARV